MSQSSAIYTDDVELDEDQIRYEAVNGAEPPAGPVPEVDDEPLTVEEFQWMQRLDNYVLERMIKAGEETAHIRTLSAIHAEWTDFAIETSEMIDQIEYRRPLSVREMYYNIMKKKRITLCALNYNDVVENIMKVYQGPPKDEAFFIKLAYMQQIEYLGMPIWQNLSNVDKHIDINAFLLLEN